MKSQTFAALFALLLMSDVAPGATADVQVANAWARAMASGQKTAVVYLDITSNADAALVAAASAAAERVELHSTRNEGGVARMRPLSKLELPAARTVRLEPNGAHLMLVNVKRPLKAGDKVPVILSIQGRGSSVSKVEVQAEVRALTAPHTHHH